MRQDPFSWAQSGVVFWTLMAEAQIVMSVRMLGLAGVLPLTQAERWRMVAEKGPAFGQAWVAAMSAAQAGQTIEQVALAAMGPVGKATRANVRRLARARGR